ncbi:MAG: nucleotidyltransferase domain-containing protein [Kiritimatiellales bacterium]
MRHHPGMVAANKIHACAREVAEKFHPEKIVLFGSYAYGTPTADSDIDLLIVMNHKGSAVKQAAEIRSSLRSAFPIDVLVRSPRKIRERLKMGDPFFETIVEKGEVLYETPDA